MKALAKTSPSPGISMIEYQKPTIKDDEVLVKIKKTAICGTDLHIYNWDEWAQRNVPINMPVGHEFYGEIIEKGSKVEGLELHDRVSGEGHITCGICRNCRAGNRHYCNSTKGIGVNHPGAFVEYLAIPAINVYKIPDTISDDLASIFDPFGNATHTALSFDLVGEDVLITGAGPIGIMAACICKHAGAKNIVITDINEFRLDLARKINVAHVVNTKTQMLEDTVSALNIVEGFDIGLEMSGSQIAFNQMIKHMNYAGNIALLGILPSGAGIDWNAIIFKSITIKGIYGRKIFDTWYKMSSMLQSGLNINPIITHHFGIDDFQKGFDIMNSGKCGKVILEW
jgi:threonine 3-dehydrogenase